MKHALISPDETALKYDGTPLGMRVAMVADAPFDVAQPLFWIECDAAVLPDQFYWDGTALIEVPVVSTYQSEPIDVVPNGGPSIVA